MAKDGSLSEGSLDKQGLHGYILNTYHQYLILLFFLQLVDLIEEHQNYLASLETLDCGKPYEDSLFDIQMALGTLRYYAGWADKIHGQTIPGG